MGEWSRLLGEYGERIVIDNFLPNIFGWRGSSNMGFRCNLQDKHRKKNSRAKLTHDLDFFSMYLCPLTANTEQLLYCSVKNTSPKSPKTDFKNYVESLFQSFECFKVNEKYAELTKNVKYKKLNHTLVLFWLNHNEKDNFDLVAEIGVINAEFNFPFDKIVLIDNKRLDFIYQAINFTKINYPNCKVEYFYHATGINESMYGGRVLASSILPIELVNSPLITFRITTKDDKKIFLAVLDEKLEEDSLKRLTGLSQNLTSGWCNKIVLCFPDYRAKNHSFIKDSVMLMFKEDNFADMIEVKCFKPSIMEFEKDDNVEFISPKTEKNNQEFNIEKMLPFGEQLRQLLTQSYINKQDITQLLSRRGVYTNKSKGKEELIPVLMTTLISPSEFEFLRKRHSNKSNSESIIADHIITNNEVNLHELIPSIDIPVAEIIKKINPNMEIINTQNFHFDNAGAIRMRIEMKEKLLTKEWAKTDVINHVEIVIRPKERRGDFSKSRVDIISTNKDSKNIAKEILNQCVEGVKKEGHLQSDVTIKKTLATEFDNLNRTKLLFSFIDIGLNESEQLSFRDITHIEFTINEEKAQLPEDIKTLKNKVEQLIFSGHNLQEIKYITDVKYHEVLNFTVINAEFNFIFGELKGKFEVSYGFPDFKGKLDDKIEFEFRIINIHPFIEKNLSKQENFELELFLKDEFNILKWKKIKTIRKKYGEQLSIV